MPEGTHMQQPFEEALAELRARQERLLKEIEETRAALRQLQTRQQQDSRDRFPESRAFH